MWSGQLYEEIEMEKKPENKVKVWRADKGMVAVAKSKLNSYLDSGWVLASSRGSQKGK